MNKKLFAVGMALLPSMAFAHPGHTDNFVNAFAHPFMGVDHLLMMLCVGIFAGRVGGAARWQLPLAFIAVMSIGYLLAANGVVIGVLESGIASGFIVLGAMFMLKLTGSLKIQMGAIALFAALHGMAHGAELNSAAFLSTGSGMLLATAILHGVGVSIGQLLMRSRFNIYREMGALLALFGSALLVTG